MTTFLVTGGAGFIGSNLVTALLAAGHDVRVLDDFSSGRRENLADARGATIIEGDVRDLATVRGAVTGVDYVLHQAAVPSVARSIEDPLTSNDANVNGTLHVLLAARDAGVRRVVMAASSSAYGETEVLPKVETMTPSPISPYAITKLVAEMYGQVFTQLYGLEVVSLRYFNVFGPRQDPASHYAAVIPRFIARMQAGLRPIVYGDGLQSRDFSYIDNVVQANLLACTAPAAPGNIYNVACGVRYDLLQLVDLLNEILGTHIEPDLQAARPGDIRHSLADIERAQRDLGYTVVVPFEEGLRATVAWYERHPFSV
ncbi:MAG: epimerase [Myxococcales bacterium]